MTKVLRCDNAPEYISHKLQEWANKRGIKIAYIQPDNPQQNAYIERFNRTVRYDWLNQEIFHSIEKVQEQATTWLWHYNNRLLSKILSLMVLDKEFPCA